MLHGVAKQHNIDLTQSLMSGDSAVDMLAAKSVGFTCILINNANEASLLVDAIECIKGLTGSSTPYTCF